MAEKLTGKIFELKHREGCGSIQGDDGVIYFFFLKDARGYRGQTFGQLGFVTGLKVFFEKGKKEATAVNVESIEE